jgi:hydrogenase nickel incorporation protein HypA/HybF
MTLKTAMHELSICQAMLSQVEQIAAEHGVSSVDRIVLLIGPLSGVEPPLLTRAFSVARCGTVAQRAEIEIQIGPILVSCNSCGTTGEASVNNLTCRKCGEWQVTVLEGGELILKSVELSVAGPANDRIQEKESPCVRPAAVQ